MNFQDLPNEIADKISELLDNHLLASAPNLKKDKCILPMLMTQGSQPGSNHLMSLQPKNGQTDVDMALSVAIEHLKKTDFDFALFSYSTQIGIGNGSVTDALKTYIFAKSGLTVVFFTPYKISGLIKKKVDYEKSLISEIIDNIYG